MSGLRLLLAAAAVASAMPGCVLDRTGQSRTYLMNKAIVDNTARLDASERQGRELERRIVKMKEEEEAYRKAVAESGANLDGLLENLNRLRGDVHALRDELRNRGARTEQLEFRLIEVEVQLAELNKELKRLRERGVSAAEPEGENGKSAVPLPPPGLPVGGEVETGGDTAPKDGSGDAGTGSDDGGSSTGDAGADGGSDGAGTGGDGVADTGARTDAEGETQGATATMGKSPEGSSGTASGGPDDLAFAKALEAYRAKSWGKAGQLFAGFTAKHPDSPHVKDAAYLRAECVYRLGDYNEAILAFQAVIEEWPESAQAARSMYMQGMSFEALGAPEDAKIFYKEVARLYPGTEDADAAETRLKELD